MQGAIRIKIIKAAKSTYWYADSILETFDVYPKFGDYVIKSDYDRGSDATWRHIKKEDAIEL